MHAQLSVHSTEDCEQACLHALHVSSDEESASLEFFSVLSQAQPGKYSFKKQWQHPYSTHDSHLNHSLIYTKLHSFFFFAMHNVN